MVSAPEQQSALTTTFSNIANNVVSQLAAACAATDTSVALLSGTAASFPPAPFYVSCEYEVMWCTSKVGDSLSVQRGRDGTTASAHPSGAIVQIRNNAGLFLDAYQAIHDLDNGVSSGSALPADIAYTDKVQSFTNKTIDLVNGNNTIIGAVTPDPAQLVYENILNNGGFEEWGYSPSTTIAAGTPTSGVKTVNATTYWIMNSTNDSAFTVSRDTANTDPSNPSGTNALLNVNTVQANDAVTLYQLITKGSQIGLFDLNKLIASPLSLAARLKLVSGNISVSLGLTYWDTNTGAHGLNTPFTALSGNTYATLKFENQILISQSVIPNGIYQMQVALSFKGTGQVALDNVMLIIGAVASIYRPKILYRPIVPQMNHAVNGGFEVWQRGTTFNITGFTGAFSADRWQGGHSNSSGTLAITADTSNQDINAGSYRCAAVVVAGTTDAVSNAALLYQQVISTTQTEGGELRNRVFSFTMRVKCSIANACRIAIIDATNNVTSYSSYHSGGGQYETLACTGLLAYNCSNGQIRVLFEAAGTYYVDNAMLVVGEVPYPYVPLHPADELNRCFRYYEPGALKPWNGYGALGQQVSMWIYWKGWKAVAPTLTKVSAWTSTNINGGSLQISYNHPDGTNIMGVLTAAGAFSIGPSATVDWSAEANP